MVDQRYTEALATAQKIDRDLAALDSDTAWTQLAQETPFLGVPFSLKEGVRVQGLHQSYGLPARADYIAPSDSDPVRALREAGAIPLCVSNVSELGMWWDSSNYVYGTSHNPYDTTRSPGGSSGGEAALQAVCGIPISIGTDTGGSIRTPAAFCGLFGHKATPGKVDEGFGIGLGVEFGLFCRADVSSWGGYRGSTRELCFAIASGRTNGKKCRGFGANFEDPLGPKGG